MTQDLISQHEQVLKNMLAAASESAEMTPHEKCMVALDVAKFDVLVKKGLVSQDQGHIVMHTAECGDDYVMNVFERARALENEYKLVA